MRGGRDERGEGMRGVWEGEGKGWERDEVGGGGIRGGRRDKVGGGVMRGGNGKRRGTSLSLSSPICTPPL